MRIEEALKTTLSAAPGLDLLSYDDLSSGLVLTSSARRDCPREVLDQVAERAVSGFALIAGTPLPPGAGAEAFGTCLIRFGAAGAEVHARSPAAPGDAVSALCAPGAALLPALRTVLGLAYRLAERP